MHRLMRLMTLLDRIRPPTFGAICAVLLSLSSVAAPLFGNGLHEQPDRVTDLRNPRSGYLLEFLAGR